VCSSDLVAPRTEIDVATTLGGLSFKLESYCPRFGQIIVSRGRRREIVVPYIVSYVFARFPMDAETWHRVMGVAGVSRILLGSVTEEEIVTLRGKVGDDTGVLSHEVRRLFRMLNRGDHVVISAGAFAGFPGTVEEVDEDLQVIGVKIGLLGREMVVNQPLAWCEPSHDEAGRSPQRKRRRQKQRSTKQLIRPAEAALL
jgi:transcription antitermination factor NusG